MKRLLTSALAGCAVLALTACGTTDPAAAASSSAPAAGSSSTEDSAASESTVGADAADGVPDCSTDTAVATGPVSLTDSYGRTVELDAPAQRVAVLEWQQVEDVLTLCLTPVAVADPAGYTLWDTAAALPDGVVDVGTRGEPNLEVLFGTDPDLVIVEAYTAADEIIGQLEKYGVPVLATKGADAADPVQNMLDTFALIAQATGRSEKAAEVTAAFRDHLAEAKDTVAAAAPATQEFVYFDGWVEGGNVSLRPFGQGSLMGELGEALGLTNAWTGEVDQAYGLGQTDIEGMTAVGDATFFYTGTDDPAGNYTSELEKNAIWASLPAVQEGRDYAFPGGIWTFGGPLSAQQALDAYVDLLTG